jgi:hypothetical protein
LYNNLKGFTGYGADHSTLRPPKRRFKMKKAVSLLPQSGRPQEDPSKRSENNAIIKITNLY